MNGPTEAFDLTRETWLPVRGLDGTSQELSLRDALLGAHEYSTLAAELGTQSFALTRLLLAVLHGALDGPRTTEDWVRLWEAGRFPEGPVTEYLDRYADQFDLFHPTTPFMQVADLRTTKGEFSDLSKLVLEVPNGERVFSVRRGRITLTPAEAARELVHTQAFDISGIHSGAVGDVRVKGGKGYPIGVSWSGLLGGVLVEGQTLWQTLCLNLMPADFTSCRRQPDIDLPSWQRAPSGPGEDEPGGRAPTGPVDLYTWQSRRILLLRERGRVVGALVCNGERLTPQNRFGVEPHTAWRRSEAQEKKLGLSPVYMPREHDPDRSIWRGLTSLLPAGSPRQGQDGARWLAPSVLEWVSQLELEGLLPADHVVRVRTAGMTYGAQSSSVSDVVDDVLALRASLLRQDAVTMAEVVTSAVGAAEAAVRAEGNLAGDLIAAAGGDGSGTRSRVMERGFYLLDRPFRGWLVGVRSSTSTVDLQVAWHREVRRLVFRLGREQLTGLSPAAWAGREVRGRTMTAAHAEARFLRDLRTAVPFAYTEDAQPTAATPVTEESA